MSNNKFKILIILSLAVGIGLRLFPTFHQPIWLDEQYSLYFSTQFSIKQLLFFFSNETHPGLYYILLKFGLKLTNSLPILRIITSLLWQISSIILLFRYHQKIKISKYSIFIISILLLFNPFFILQSWQLRMYSIAFFFTIINYIFFKLWDINKTKKNLILLIIGLFMGNMTTYSMFFLTFSFGLLTIWRKFFTTFKKRIIYSLLLITALIIQFILLSGMNYQSQFNGASWINSPANGVSNVYLTTLGFSNDINNYQPTYLFKEIIFLFGSVFLLLSYRKLSNIKKLTNSLTEFNFLFFLPITIILLISVSLPFLSQRFFFHNFVPDLSLFLPRTHLPFVILLSIYLPQLIEKIVFIKNFKFNKIRKIFLTFVFIFFSIIWGSFYYSMNINNKYASKSTTNLIQNIINDKETYYAWPEWILYQGISTNKLSDIPIIHNNYLKSSQLNNILWRSDINKNERSELICKTLYQKKIIIKKSVVTKLDKPASILDSAVSDCCTKINSNNLEISQWECN